MRSLMLKKAVPAAIFGAVSMGGSIGMDLPATGTDANTAMHTVGLKLHKAIHANHPINSVKCPMGVNQTLALLHAVAEKRIQTEITQFTADQDINSSMTNLNQLLQANCQSYVPKNKDDDIFSLADNKKFDFTNGVYALLSNTIVPKEGAAAKLSTLGAQLLSVDFNNSEAAAATINGIVEKDTRGKITEILSADSFTQDSAFVLLHTLYVNASWDLDDVEKTNQNFTNLSGDKKRVKFLEVEGTKLRFSQTDGVNLVTLPTFGGCHLTIRHSKDTNDLRPITEAEIAALTESQAKYVRSFTAPYVSMKSDWNLKELLGNDLPQVLKDTYKTELCSQDVYVSAYIQKVTFDMSNKGVEASAATAMGFMMESCCMYRDGPVIKVDSAFSFALTKTMNGKEYLLFQGQVVDHDVLKS